MATTLNRIRGHTVSSRSSSAVLIACPKTQHSYQAALALQERGVLSRYVTGFYYKRPSFAASAISILPERYRSRMEREFLRRRMEHLDDRLIESVALGDLLCAAIERHDWLRPWSQRLDLWSYHLRRFQRETAKKIRTLRPRVVLCYDTCSRQIFEAAHDVGAMCVLDQTIGHITKCVAEFAAAEIELSLPKGFVSDCTLEVHEADAILAPSEYVVSSLTEIGVPLSKIVQLPFGVDLERFHQASPSEQVGPVRALYVGQISARKGVRYLTEAFDQLHHPNLHLTIMGRLLGDPGWVRPRDERFLYRPPVPQHEIDAAYRSADFFVQLSLHEGSALTIFEALASGLPVITTPNAGSVVRDGIEGFIVPPRDVDAVMHRMRTLVEDSALRTIMSERARRRAEMFGWKSYRQRLAALLGDLAAAEASERQSVLRAHQEVMQRVIEGQTDEPRAARAAATPS